MRKLIVALVHMFTFAVGIITLVKANQMELSWVFYWTGGAVMVYAFVLEVILLAPKPMRVAATGPKLIEPEVVTPYPPTDYGRGYKARELENGKWVLWCERKNAACDLANIGYLWRPGDRYFCDCMGSRHKVDSLAKEIMAARGVFKS